MPTRLSRLRPWTTRLFNPLSRHVVGRLPGFGLLIYRGRTTGRTYRTPMNVFRDGEGYVFALTYGAEVQWVKNILAAGTCTLRTRGRDVPLVDPVLFQDPARRRVPLPVRLGLRLMGADEFLSMRVA
jgi:deazaflavin-dependent oxidoreductase (nitroreductase family)